MIGIVNRNFKDLDRDFFILIYKVWSEVIQNMVTLYGTHIMLFSLPTQKKFRKGPQNQLKACVNCRTETLVNLQLPTLKFRRIRGAMIEVFKILTQKCDTQVTPALPLSGNLRTRGHGSYKLLTRRSKYDLRKYSFSCRIVKLWNSLPDDVVTACSVNSFKNKLDDHWKHKEVYFNYEAELISD